MVVVVNSDTLRKLRSALAGTRWTNPAERSQKFTWAGKGKCNRSRSDQIIHSLRPLPNTVKPRPVTLSLRILASALPTSHHHLSHHIPSISYSYIDTGNIRTYGVLFDPFNLHQSPISLSARVQDHRTSWAGQALSPSVAPKAPALARAHFDLSYRGISADGRLSFKSHFR